jgi:hypothetical protein
VHNSFPFLPATPHYKLYRRGHAHPGRDMVAAMANHRGITGRGDGRGFLWQERHPSALSPPRGYKYECTGSGKQALKGPVPQSSQHTPLIFPTYRDKEERTREACRRAPGG